MGLGQDLASPACRDLIEDFECVICREFVFEPQVCAVCKKLFCEQCIKEWLFKTDKCPFKCSPNKMTLTEMNDELFEKYIIIEFKCTKSCGNYVPLLDYKDHLASCDLTNCSNNVYCKRKAFYIYKEGVYCSYLCYKAIKYSQKMAKTEGDLEKLSKLANIPAFKRGFPMKWNFAKSSPQFTIQSNNRVSLDNKGAKVFRTLVSTVGFMGGYGKVKFYIKNSTNHLRIGVTSTLEFDANRMAFSDIETGFAYYTIGQTRNDSSYSGLPFGENLNLTGETVIEMTVNMGEGKLNFKANDKNLGDAFEEIALTKGPLYPAISAGHIVEEIRITLE